MSTISDAEAQVMEILWSAPQPLTADELAAALQPQQRWTLSTVKTLLARLVKKEALATEKDGRRFLYRPLLARDEWLRQQSAGFLERFFGGHLSALVSHFAEQRPLSAADRKALSRLLENKEGKKK